MTYQAKSIDVTGQHGGIGIYGDLRARDADRTQAEQITTRIRFAEGDTVEEGDSIEPAADDCGSLDDLLAVTTKPTRGFGVAGFTAVFVPASSTGLKAKDLIVDGTAYPRDVTVQAIMSWDIAAQNTYGAAGSLIARGLGNGAGEYMCFAVELVVVDAATRTGSVRWLWQTAAGVLKTETGASFIVPASGFFLLTCTRRWVSPTEVDLRYYINADMIGEVTSADGDIAGVLDATTTIGTRFTGGAYGRFLAGAIDELAIANFEMSREEIESTWLRLSVFQPDGYRQIQDLMPPGIPISSDPSSKVQTDLRTLGLCVGFGDAVVENMRANMMPDRAYGAVLRRWERITEQPPKPGDSIDVRRGRVVGQLRKRAGVSPPGVREALRDLLDLDADDIEILAFDNTIRDDFATLEYERWRAAPEADWTVTGGELRVQAIAGDFPWDVTTPAGGGKSALIGIEPPRGLGTPANGLHTYVSMRPVTLPANSEAGIVLWNWPSEHMLFFGLRNVAGAYRVGYQRYEAGVATDGAWVVLATTALQAHSLRVRPNAAAYGGPADQQDYDLSWSLTASEPVEADWTTGAALRWMRDVGWAGLYFRTFAATGGAADVRFSDFAQRNTNGTRPFYWYVRRDPGLPGSPDLRGAESVIQRMRHAFTRACVITSVSMLTDDPDSPVDCGPLGAL